MKKTVQITFFFCLLFTQQIVSQTITVARTFNTNMVLQQSTMVPVWGWATAGTQVDISLALGSNVISTTKAYSDSNGKWLANIQTPAAVSGQAPQYTLVAKGPSNTITFTNVLVGEVWLCTGQSNMTFTMVYQDAATNVGVVDYANEINAANYPNVRLFTCPLSRSLTPLTNLEGGSWSVCNPTNVAKFSAVGYYFGRELNTKLNIPIGLLVAAKSGSAIQTWIKNETLVADATLKTKYVDPVTTATTDESRPSYFYNGIIAPLFPLAIKGAIWYQGESNTGDGTTYTKANIAMINDWRTDFGINFSFYAVQITPRLNIGAADLYFGRAMFRDYQANIQTIAKTGIIATNDLMQDGDERAVAHPHNKKDVGQRLAYWAMAKDYGQPVQYLGPLYQSMAIEGNSIRITFKAESLSTGLISKDGKNLTCFRIAGSDQKFYPATGIISGNTIIVNSPSVSTPVAVRFAYTEGSMANLMNKQGIIAYPFRTDSWTSPTYMSGAEPYITGINDNKIKSFNVYPNPFKDKLFISGENVDIKSVELIDLIGRKINVLANVNNSDLSFNSSEINQGAYLLNIRMIDNSIVTYKVFKNI
ncbi:MAG: sialate O-acetylesterase [Paludibacter sp.]